MLIFSAGRWGRGWLSQADPSCDLGRPLTVLGPAGVFDPTLVTHMVLVGAWWSAGSTGLGIRA